LSKRQAYVRVTETFEVPNGDPVEVIAGVELHPNITLRWQYDQLRRAVKVALSPSILRNYSDAGINGRVEDQIRQIFGNQVSYFIEVGRGKLDEYVQVYQP